MKRSTMAVAALLVAVSMSQAALITLPASVTRALNPVFALLGRGDVSTFLSSLRVSPQLVGVRQAAPSPSPTISPFPSAGVAPLPVHAPERAAQPPSFTSPTPVREPEQAVEPPNYARPSPTDDQGRTITDPNSDTRHDNGLHRGWYIGKHNGWYRQAEKDRAGRASEDRRDDTRRSGPAPVVPRPDR